MAGWSTAGCCFTSLVLLMALQLAFFTTNSGAARSHPYDLLQFLSGSVTAVGERAFNDEPCCTCICPKIWPPMCVCAGDWEGSCPAACTNCKCEGGRCRCEDGLIDEDKCQASSCHRRSRESSEKNSLPTSKENGDVVY